MNVGKYFIEDNLELDLEDALDSCGAVDLVDYNEKTINDLANDYGYAYAHQVLENL